MNILFVCTGNTCRSPMAEGYLKYCGYENVFVRSRGINAYPVAVSDNARRAMQNVGIDITEHIAQQLTGEDVLWADKIFCMSLSHKEILDKITDKNVSVLGFGIPDPFGSELAIYENCRDKIFNAIDREMIDFTVKPMDKSHLDGVVALEKECFSSPWSKQSLLDALEVGTKFFVSERNGAVLGYIGISCILDEGYVTNVAVFSKHRKTGIATSLVKRVLNLKDEIGLSFVSLEVRRSNQNAISLYKKLGFCEEGIRRNFYTCPSEDAIIMTKRFK